MGLVPTSAKTGSLFNSGNGAGPSCVLETAGIDAHAAGTIAAKWTVIGDNQWDFNHLSAIPAGLGMTFSFDGSSANITATQAGIWAFSLSVQLPQDATAVVYVRLPFTGNGANSSAALAHGTIFLSCGQTIALPLEAGVTDSVSLITEVAATANPYTIFPTLEIVRLA